MKILYISVLFCLMLLLNNSCSDSLGIEPNVLKKKLSIDTTKIDTTKPPPSVKIKATIDSIYFQEDFFKDPNNSIRVAFQSELTRAIVYADTSQNPPYVWIDMRVDNNNDEKIYDIFERTIYAKAIQFKADSFPANDVYRLNGSINSGYWSEIIVKRVRAADTLYLSGADTKLELNLETISKKKVNANINAFIPNRMPDDRTLILKGSFIINIP